MTKVETTIALMKKDIEYIKNSIGDIKRHTAEQVDSIRDDIEALGKELKSSYVTQKEFDPVKTVVYGLVGLILAGVIGATITLVIKNG